MAASFAIILRVVLNYVVIYITFRLMGKREVGELSLVDLIVYLMIAEIAAISIEALDKPYYQSLVAILLLLILQKTVAYVLLKRANLRSKLDGAPSVIIANGRVNYYEMRKNRYNFDDLLSQLRESGIRSISEVEFAILEANGTLSTFTKDEGKPFISPLPLVVSGELVKENFKYVDIDELDFMTLLRNQGYMDIKEILYANYENSELYVLALKNDEKGSGD